MPRSTDSPEAIKRNKKMAEIRQEKEALKEAAISQLRKRLKAGEITQEEFHVGELQAFIKYN